MGRFRLLLGLLLCALCAYGTDNPNTLTLQRSLFLAAETALRSGDHVRYDALKAQLQSYPLYPYLRYEELELGLDTATLSQVDSFLNDYGDTLIAARLRHVWLLQLARQQRWTDYLSYYKDAHDVVLQCYYHLALYQIGNRKAASVGIDALWLVGNPQPPSCDAVFTIWRQAGGLSEELIWRRLQLAMEADNVDLSRSLSVLLPTTDRKWAEAWIGAYQNPRVLLGLDILQEDDPRARNIALYAISRWAREDASAASDAWKDIQAHYHFDKEQRSQAEYELAMAHALQGRYEDLEYLARIDPEYMGGTLKEWRIRLALRLREWQTALSWIAALSAGQRSDPRWQYWRARALQETGQPQANGLFETLASTRNYFGFLAADRLGQPYVFEYHSLSFSEESLSQIEILPGIQRARELFFLNRLPEARHEWQYALRGMDNTQLARAAQLAERWGWHDRAILTMADTPYQDDLQLRFPIPHLETLIEVAKTSNVDPAWAYAVIRQESVFMPDVRSSAGALGLMQLMPYTARQIAQGLKLPFLAEQTLLDADTNIQLGVNYLRTMLDRFNGNAVLATAAYNAGPERIQHWLPADKPMPADLWVETVPFGETRAYLEQVFAYTIVYDYRLGRTPTPLQVRMLPIQANDLPKT